ncbi:MAG TPA: NUDIX domain-containing protein [Lysobacter sp.]|jgi:predicted NUDIX family NTP pyrophosphohydrolase|nr:NUDIX domain-containing protein [Lysobacter sp.]
MPKESAGILMYKRQNGEVLVLLAHPGGPFWRNRDEGAWTIPKGEPGPDETSLAAAQREFEEELGAPAAGTLQPLGRIRQSGGKWVEAFALEGDFDLASLRSNMFEMEWPPHSGRMDSFPEVDRAMWLPLPLARRKILSSQETLLDRLEALLLGSSMDTGNPFHKV